MLLWWGRPVNENRPERLLRAFFLRRLLVLHAVPGPGAGPGKGEVRIHQRLFHGGKANRHERDGQPRRVILNPVTTRNRGFRSEILIEPDRHNGLDEASVAQCHHIRAVASVRINQVRGNVGPVALARIRDTVGLILDIPS